MKKHSFSIIVPVYNDEKGLKDTLHSLTGMSFPADLFEIIVVDNGSDDRSLNIAYTYQKNYPGLIQVLSENTVRSSYAARNEGIKKSSGEILVFLDANMSVNPDFLDRLNTVFIDDSPDYTGFRVVLSTGDPANFFERFDKHTAFPVEGYLRFRHFCPTCCLAVKKKVFEKIGLFDPLFTSGGDYEFGNRVYDNGMLQSFTPSIEVYHPARNGFASLAKKAFRVGRGRAVIRNAGIKLYRSNEKNPAKHIAPFGENILFHILKLCLFGIKCVGFASGYIKSMFLVRH